LTIVDEFVETNVDADQTDRLVDEWKLGGRGATG
jgi:hypothetical protein